MPDAVRIPKGLAKLGPGVKDEIATLVKEAERRQDRELNDALKAALRGVPRPLRGVVRKVLGA